MTPRAKFIKSADSKRVAAMAFDAMRMASVHDPDIVKWLKEDGRVTDKAIKEIRSRLIVIERQLERLGAPQYRLVKKGKKAR